MNKYYLINYTLLNLKIFSGLIFNNKSINIWDYSF